jgi:predicted AAA+ superfamily ATPase
MRLGRTRGAGIQVDNATHGRHFVLHEQIKMVVDRSDEPGLFWLTGSQQLHLMRGISESLAGRVVILQLLGLSRQELLGQGLRSSPYLPTPEQIAARSNEAAPFALQALYEFIWRGSLPRIALNQEVEPGLFWSSYVQTYLQRDVRDLARVGDEMAFLRFLRAAAARTAQLLNLTDLARDADVSPNTAKSWLSILQTSGIIYLLEPYRANVTQRLIKAPKLYFLDTGLVAYLTQWATPQTLEAGAMSGALLETWVIAELLKSYYHKGRTPPFYYYRDKDGREIDLLIAQDGILYPLEIKKTASPSRDDVRNFAELEKQGMAIGPGGVVCLAAQSLPLTATAYSIPVWTI